MAEDPFESPKQLIGRARSQIDELEKDITAFFDQESGKPVIREDPKTGQQVHTVLLTKVLPSQWTLVLKDAIGNLRDALDHAVYSAAIVLGVTNPEKTAFPFGKDHAAVESSLAGRNFGDVPPKLRPFLIGLKPYPGGNLLLQYLNKIRNPNTHRTLVPTGSAMTSSMRFSGALNGPTKMGYSLWLPETNEIEFMRLGRGSKADYHLNFNFRVIFGGIDIVRGKLVVPTLNEIASEVERIVLEMELEATRLQQLP